jgi:1-aminocyclopropane-1-carboxylate deaminase/D-cysteine desulfhydrase-like pyridoxal-dependent ACC family enzyme
MSLLTIDYHTLTQEIHDPQLDSMGIHLSVKRDDQNDQLISGNKFRKLKYNLIEADKLGYRTLITFGGAYSNHIHALAAAGQRFGFKTIGIIRGEKPPTLNPTLADTLDFGMDLQFISRTDYRDKHTAAFAERLVKRFGPHYLVPEGGSNALALVGCIEMVQEFKHNYDYICLACGTGGTMAGIIAGLQQKGQVMGFPVLKGGSFLSREIARLVWEYNKSKHRNWKLLTDYHFGGYARYNWDLIQFINRFYTDHNIPLDPVYTGKMMFGVFDQVKKGYFRKGSKILAIHTGGLQGIRGFNDRFGKLIRFDPRESG